MCSPRIISRAARTNPACGGYPEISQICLSVSGQRPTVNSVGVGAGAGAGAGAVTGAGLQVLRAPVAVPSEEQVGGVVWQAQAPWATTREQLLWAQWG